MKFLMSWLPPFSRAGTVRAPSRAIATAPVDPLAVPASVFCSSGGSASGGTRSGSVSMSARSRVFQRASSSADGAVPNRPGWVIPCSGRPGGAATSPVCPCEVPDRLVGVGEVVGQEAAAVGLREDAGVAPALAWRVAVLLRGLHRAQVEDVDDEQVARLGALHSDRSAEHVRDG